MLKCPKCDVVFPDKEDKGKIIDTEFVFDKKLLCYTVRRRRKCNICNTKWTTVEVNKLDILKFKLTNG